MATRNLDKEFGVNSSTAIADDATGTKKLVNRPDATGIAYDSVDGFIKYNDAGNIRSLVNAEETQTISGTKTFTNASFVGGTFTPPANLSKGHIHLDITTARIISGNAIQNTTEAGVPDGNTAGPALTRVNGATDKALLLSWAANEVNEIQFAPFAYPQDLDDAAAVEVHIVADMAAGGMDTPTIAVGYFEGVGDTDAGGNTAALSTTTTEYTVSIAAGNVGAHPAIATVTLTPAAHANEALRVRGVWVEYTKKTS